MKLLVIYGTTKGHTAKIAARIGRTLRDGGDEVDVVDGRAVRSDFDLARYGGIIIGASVNAGRFQRHIGGFIKAHRDEIQKVPSAFFSVSLTEADPDPKKHARAMNPITRLQEETGWYPGTVASFAGSIAYLRYRWLMRLIWPRLPLPAGHGTGRLASLTNDDYEYTDWGAVTRFAHEFATTARARQQSPGSGCSGVTCAASAA